MASQHKVSSRPGFRAKSLVGQGFPANFGPTEDVGSIRFWSTTLPVGQGAKPMVGQFIGPNGMVWAKRYGNGMVWPEFRVSRQRL